MSSQLVKGVDFVGLPTRDLASAVEFHGTTLGIPMSVHMPERNFADPDGNALMLHHRYTARQSNA